MYINKDAEFVKEECLTHGCKWDEDKHNWLGGLKTKGTRRFCRAIITGIQKQNDGNYLCFFTNNECWRFPRSCIMGTGCLDELEEA